MDDEDDRKDVKKSPDGSRSRDDIERISKESPGNSPLPSPRDFLVSASPPKFVSFDEIMKAANGVANMSLAHEIAVDNDFRFSQKEPEKDSIERQITEVMHKAFWDILKEKLQETPPDFSHALLLLQEVKENLQQLLLPQHERLQVQIGEVLDLELIEQQADQGVIDFQYYANFVIGIMAKMCAPARDAEINNLKEEKDIVPLFKAIFSVLDMMKMDMANFNIQQIRPYIQQHSVEYERDKFQALLQQQKENNMDGLLYTKSWLRRSAEEVLKKNTAPEASAQAQTGSTMSPTGILHNGYMQVLDWPEEQVFPETILMDQKRFMDLKEKTRWLTLISSILLVTYSTVGASISGITDLKEKLKNDIATIIAGVPFKQLPVCAMLFHSNLKDTICNVSEQVNKDVNECLKEHGFSELTEERQLLLKGQVEKAADSSHPVYQIMRRRLFGCVEELLLTAGKEKMQIPAGFSALSDELSHVCGQFLRLVMHNKSVFGIYYANILTEIIQIDTSPDER